MRPLQKAILAAVMDKNSIPIPLQVPGLKLWINSSQIFGLADGDGVTTWSDKSGNTHDATEATHPPIYKVNIVNGHPVVRFNGTNQFMTIANHADFDMAAPWHAFLVVAPAVVNTSWKPYVDKASAWGFVRDTNKIDAYKGVVEYKTTKAYFEVNIFMIHEIMFDTGFDVSYYINGWFKEKVVDSSNPPVNANNITLGKGGGDYWSGDIAEILIYSGTIGASDRLKLRNYMGSKYNIYIAINDVDFATATNAVSPLTTPTADGHGETTQPDVVFVDAGWNGYKYWMAMTPYWTGDRRETVEIITSADGTTWAAPAGLTNPVLALPPAGYAWADPSLVFSPDGLTLNCVYLKWRQPTDPDKLCLISTTDGITWANVTTPTVILTGDGTEFLTSPSVLWDGSQYVLYTCDTNSSPRRLMRRTCATLTGTWSAPTACVLHVSYGTSGSWPDSHFPYHGHVKFAGGIYYGYYTNNVLLNSYLISSADGINWQIQSSNTLVTGNATLLSGGAGAWDKNQYSGSILKLASGFDLFYGANDGAGTAVYRIGRTTIAGIV